MRTLISILLAVLLKVTVLAQGTLSPADPFFQKNLDRYRVLMGENEKLYHSSFRPVSRVMAADLLAKIDTTLNRSARSQQLFDYLENESWFFAEPENNETDKALLQHFYKKKSDLFFLDEPALKLRINPVIHFSAGYDRRDPNQHLYINTRAIEVRGFIDEKVGFYSFVSENQARFPVYVRDRTSEFGAVPGEGFFKPFKEGGYDFFNARGYIDFNATKHINIQFGHNRFRIGHGIRSVLLSDNAPPYLFLKTQARVWRFNYTSLFTQLTQNRQLVPAGLNGAGRYPLKYMVMHHLSLNLGKKVNIGFFESVMTGATDGGSGRFKMEYLNPVIFYRSIEHQNGSADNVQLGMDAEWLITPGLSLYGQFMLDEFKLSEVRAGDGWWGNKYAALLNLRYINAFGIDQLDLSLEGSQARPYNYSHYTPFGSYSHYQQFLGHARGSNFREGIFDIQYQPFPKWFINSRTIIARYGLDSNGSNWGSNPLINYTSREEEYGNFIGQGAATSSVFTDFTISYMFWQNMFLDMQYIYRQVNSEIPEETITDQIIQASLRLNIARRRQEF